MANSGSQFLVGLLQGLAQMYGQQGLQRMQERQKQRQFEKNLVMEQQAFTQKAPLRAMEEEEYQRKLRQRADIETGALSERRKQTREEKKAQLKQEEEELIGPGGPFHEIVKKGDENAIRLRMAIRHPEMLSLLKDIRQVSPKVSQLISQGKVEEAGAAALETGSEKDQQAVIFALRLQKNNPNMLKFGPHTYWYDQESEKWIAPPSLPSSGKTAAAGKGTSSKKVKTREVTEGPYRVIQNKETGEVIRAEDKLTGREVDFQEVLDSSQVRELENKIKDLSAKSLYDRAPAVPGSWWNPLSKGTPGDTTPFDPLKEYKLEEKQELEKELFETKRRLAERKANRANNKSRAMAPLDGLKTAMQPKGKQGMKPVTKAPAKPETDEDKFIGELAAKLEKEMKRKVR